MTGRRTQPHTTLPVRADVLASRPAVHWENAIDWMEYERPIEVIGLADFERLSGLSRDAIVRTMDGLQPEVEEFYNLAVLVLCCCGGRLPADAPLSDLRARYRRLTTNGDSYDVLGDQAEPENDLPSPSSFD